MTAIELTIVIKDSERRQSQKFLIYEKVTMDQHDPVIDKCLDEAIKNFNGEPEDIKLNAMMILK